MQIQLQYKLRKLPTNQRPDNEVDRTATNSDGYFTKGYGLIRTAVAALCHQIDGR